MTAAALPRAAEGCLGWAGVVRVGLVQAAIGAVVVLMTATVNRVMVVELALPASVPGALVALHFAVQLLLRPQLGFRSDRAPRRTPWIIGGLLLLASAGVAASASTALLASARGPGLVAATVSFLALGAGVSAAGTPLLALLAEQVAPSRRARAAAIVWLMMIAGFVATTLIASRLLAPFSLARLVGVTALIGGGGAVLAVGALLGLERPRSGSAAPAAPATDWGAAVRAVWAEPAARTFALFIFIAMLAYSAQDLILEPYGGLVFGLSPAETTRISGMHQGGMLLGMLAAAVLATRDGALRAWATWGCAGSALGFLALILAPVAGTAAALGGAVLLLGLCNGAFAIGAIGCMMAFSVTEGGRDAGVRMGVFGAAQAVAYAIGGFAGALLSDLARLALGSVRAGYGLVFALEAALFVAAAVLAARTTAPRAAAAALRAPAAGDTLLASLG
ncbi:MAG: BCD family MFS transporter [Gemmatimonadales bacterium]|nr:BCD family MFS transporter [Gemmatimonadales bacterium]